jgi:uncharacterized protein (DUF608 family)
MVTFKAESNLSSGVPLGGIGAGKVEINNLGKMINLTIANNWQSPMLLMRGFHVLVRPEDADPFFMESNLPMIDFEKYEPDEMRYRGEYPFATLMVRKGKVEATLELFSPIIPRNLPDSTLPAFGMSIKLSGSNSGKVVVSASNIAGTNLIGKSDKAVQGGVKFVNRRSNDFDGAKGEQCLISDKTVQTCVQYNLNVRPAVALSMQFWKYGFESPEPWSQIMKGEQFQDNPHEVLGQWDDPAGAVISEYREAHELRYVYSWYFTGRWVLYPYGHYYHTQFSGAEQVANYFLENFDRLRSQSREWHDTFIGKDLPEWLRDAIINSTYVLSSSTWLDEKGRFALIEATQNDPNVGAICAFCHETGSLPVLKMFPELEKGFLKSIAKETRPDGYIPHCLGILSFDHADDGTTSPPGWKDIGPTFVLLVYRYYLETHDLRFLEEMYSTMMNAIIWDLKQDRDGDGLPELEGQGDGGFDATSITGIESCTSSTFVASLAALRAMCEVLGKRNDKQMIEGMLKKARDSFSELYNGKYFEAWKGEPDPKGYVFLGQLAGEWWTNLLGLESVADRQKMESAYEEILAVNAKASPYCTPNLVHESGRIWDLSCQSYSSWPRLVFCVSGVRYREGDSRWLEVARKEWDNLVQRGLVWDHPSRIDGRTGYPDPAMNYLDHYAGSPAIWTFTM